MPTPRGYLTAIMGLGLWAAGRLFGTGPLEQIGIGLIVLVVGAVFVVNSRRHEVEFKRSISPHRARAGQRVEVKLKLKNRGRGSAPLMLLDDQLPVELTGHARFALNGLEPDGRRDVHYQLRAPRRGRYPVGPLRIHFVDPFGLASIRLTGVERGDLLVHPRVESLGLPRDLGQKRSLSTTALRQLSGARGEDFYTLREYAEGDDLRKIHWPSTAKRRKPMIRQEETPWHTRAVILLDDRRGSHQGLSDASSFERAVEAAASIADLYHRAGYTYRFDGVSGMGVPAARGSDHYHRCLDLLATMQPEGRHSFDDALLKSLAELEHGMSEQGTLVVIVGSLERAGAVAITRCLRRFRQVITIIFPGHRFGTLPTKLRWEGERDTHDAVTLLTRSGADVLVLGPGEPLTSAWLSVSSSGRGGERAWGPKRVPV